MIFAPAPTPPPASRTRRPAARGLAGVALLATLCGCDGARLVGVGSEKEALEIITLLADNQVSARTHVQKRERALEWEIQVPADSLARGRSLLVTHNLPRAPQSGFETLLGQVGLIPSSTDERARLMHATAGELARTLEGVPGVVAARVHIVLPGADGLGRTNPQSASASVVVQYRGPDADSPAEAAPPLTVEQVRKMVAAGVEGLRDADEQRIQVLLLPTPPARLPGLGPAWPLRERALLSAVGVLALAAVVLLLWNGLQRLALRRLRAATAGAL